MKRKSIICLLLCAVLCLNFYGCAKNKNNSQNNSESLNDFQGSLDGHNKPSADKTQPDNANPDKDESNDSFFPGASDGAIEKFEFSDSGKIISKTGTNLNLYIKWNAFTDNGKNMKVKFTVGIESYSIQVGARPNLGIFALDDEKYKFSTDALTLTDNHKKSETDFFSFEKTYLIKKGFTLKIPVYASWPFNGIYGGTSLNTIVTDGYITIEIPEKV